MEKPLKILVLEDVQDDVGLIERELRKGGLKFETIRVDSRKEFMDALRKYKADVILSDHSLPQFNSFEGSPSVFVLPFCVSEINCSVD